MVALAAYFDASSWHGVPCGSHDEIEIVAVAGYLGRIEMWNTFFTPWWSMMLDSAPSAIREFKASDCRQERVHPWQGRGSRVS